MIDADLQGKTALVTGGASGIGLATASLLARCGAAVAINDRPENPALGDAVEALAEQGLSVLAAPGDIGDPASVSAMVETAVSALGRLDYLINNAGTAMTSKPRLRRLLPRLVPAPPRGTLRSNVPCRDRWT